jgi:hypothetical protein
LSRILHFLDLNVCLKIALLAYLNKALTCLFGHSFLSKNSLYIVLSNEYLVVRQLPPNYLSFIQLFNNQSEHFPNKRGAKVAIVLQRQNVFKNYFSSGLSTTANQNGRANKTKYTFAASIIKK